MLCGEPGCHALKSFTNREQLANVIDARMCDDQSTLWTVFGQPHRMQPMKGLAHRGPANAKSLRQIGFGQPASRTQFAALDEIEDVVDRIAAR